LAARNPEVEAIKKKFKGLNEFISSRHGWITSIPGAVVVTVECLPGSTLPDEPRKAGYEVTEIGEGERIFGAAIVQQFCIRADGALEPLIAGSACTIAFTVTHAGICTMNRYALCMP
jgi:hypothetical protein